LEQADRLVRTRCYALELTDTFLPAAFLELFGSARDSRWDRSTLGELTLDFSYGTSTKCSDTSSLQAVLRIPNVIRGAIDTTDLKFGELSPNEQKKLRLDHGDLLFVRTNGNPDYVGRCAVFDLEAELYFASYLIRARTDQKLIAPAFLAAYLRMPDGRRSMQPSIRTTAGQYNVSVEGLRDVQVIVPPLPLQQKFAALVEQERCLRAVRREALRQAEHLFASLLDRAAPISR
jgi:type I restriction enzyme, S subunit